jgi:hypothetical protein
MPDHTRILAAARRALIDLAATLLIIAGGALLTGGWAYRVFLRPELPSPEAATVLWPVLLAGVVALLAGWWVDRAEG